MRLYTGTSETLIADTQLNCIADMLSAAFFAEYRRKPSPQEESSWRNSLRALASALQYSELRNLGVALEYRLPKAMYRLDCLFTGCDEQGREGAVIVELKQWQECLPSDGPNEVRTLIGGMQREVAHPSMQVAGYRQFLADGNSAFFEGEKPLALAGCAFLHNYPHNPNDHLLSEKFSALLQHYPVFTKDEVPTFSRYLRNRLQGGRGSAVLEKLDNGVERPNKRLLDHVARMIAGEPEFVLLDEQRVVYDLILTAALRSFDGEKKTAFLIKGGPGTGKSLIALNLLADLMLREKDVYYATGSKAFTTTLQKIVGMRAKSRFTYFMHAGNKPANSIDVLIADEAHRIRKDNNTRFTKEEQRNPLPQIETLLSAARVPVFFIDDRQLVRPDEKGSTALIHSAAAKLGIEVKEFELEAQFRCGGSEGFVQWIDNTLEVARTPIVIWDVSNETFDFQIFDSAEALDDAIREKAKSGATARMTAGYCWPWTEQPLADGSLEVDVRIGAFRRPWNASTTAKGLAKGIPPANLWAYQSSGIEQVGCVYTAQGFEFDYVGVIFGPDLRYDFDKQGWVGDKAASHDAALKRSGDAFLDLVKNTYRVLLTRGLKGCYVHFTDKQTERFVKSRIERTVSESTESVGTIVTDPGDEAYSRYLPLYSLEAAAGAFSSSQSVEPEGWIDVGEGRRFHRDHFVARVVGRSMLPLIPDGSLCIFRFIRAGSRQGKIVLVQSHALSDPENGGRFTVKTYRSEKVFNAHGEWQHARITLSPRNTDFDPIELIAANENDVAVIAEFVRVVR